MDTVQTFNRIGTDFDQLIMAADLKKIRDIYYNFFSGLSPEAWRRPARKSPLEWNLRKTVAHLNALTHLCNQSIQAALYHARISFPGIETRYDYSSFNEQLIHAGMCIPVQELYASLLDGLDESACNATILEPAEFNCMVELPIFTRPVSVAKLLEMTAMHTGVTHSAQLTESTCYPPLWTCMSPALRHRQISRVIQALSLLYRTDLASTLIAAITFRIAGEGGGAWHVNISPHYVSSGEGEIENPSSILWFRDTGTFFNTITGRLKPVKGLISGKLRFRGNFQLLRQLRSLFSVDAKKLN